MLLLLLLLALTLLELEVAAVTVAALSTRLRAAVIFLRLIPSTRRNNSFMLTPKTQVVTDCCSDVLVFLLLLLAPNSGVVVVVVIAVLVVELESLLPWSILLLFLFPTGQHRTYTRLPSARVMGTVEMLPSLGGDLKILMLLLLSPLEDRDRWSSNSLWVLPPVLFVLLRFASNRRKNRAAGATVFAKLALPVVLCFESNEDARNRCRRRDCCCCCCGFEEEDEDVVLFLQSLFFLNLSCRSEKGKWKRNSRRQKIKNSEWAT